MKILVIGDTSGNLDEGMKKVSYRICEKLNDLNDCDAVFASIKDVFWRRRLYRDIQIIHFMTGPSWRTFLYARVSKLLLAKSPLVVVSFIHPAWSRLASISFTIFRPDAVIVQSDKWFTRVEGKVKFINRVPLAGINIKKFHSISDKEKVKLKAKLKLPLDKIIVLHVGHLNVGRNLSIFNQFEGSSYIYPLVIGSSTVPADQELVYSLNKSGVQIINEYIPKIEDYYMAADCYLFPTVDSSFAIQIPLSVLEALACNIPVISTRFEALPEYVAPDPPRLTYLNSFVDIEKKVRDIFIESSSNVNSEINSDISRFDWPNIASEMYEYYQLILQNNGN